MPHRFLAIAATLLALTGCTSNGDYRRPISQGGTMVGPYDVTLTSHQEALGIRTR